MKGFRLSPQQRRLFQHGTRLPAERSRRVGVFRLSAGLDPARLDTALAALVERYEILRTAFPPVPGLEVPLQVPGEAREARVTWFDWSAESDESVAERTESLRRELLAQPAGVADGDLLDVRAARLPNGQTLIVWSQAAVGADAESLRLLVEELLGRYTTNGSSPVQDEPLQYADLAEWLNEILEDEDAEEGLAFWSDLATRATSRKLSIETAQGDESAEVGSLRVELPDTAREALIARPVEGAGSRRDALLAVWSRSLAYYADGDSVTIETLFDGRSYEGLDEAIGPFARYLPIVIDLESEDRLEDLEARVSAACATASEWQEYFSRERLERSEAPAHAFSYVTAAEIRLGDGTKLSTESQAGRIEPHSLELACLDRGDSLTLELRCDTGAVSRTAAERVAASFATLLDAALALPDRPLVEHSLVDGQDRLRLIAAAAGDDVPAPETSSILETIARSAGSSPDATALISGGDSLDYAGAWERAGHIAAELQSLGVERGEIVAVCCHRSVDMVVALLGVMRAGGAYLPLDPAHPDDRLDFMLDDAGVRFTVCHEPTAERVAALATRAVRLDQVAEQGPRDHVPEGDDLAYVIYTSGSTGTPKAVAVTHANLLHSTTAREHFYESSPRRFLLLSSYAFDSSVVGLFWTLSSGGTLIVPEEGSEQDIGLLADLIEEHRVTHTLCLPTLYGVLLEQTPVARLRSLELVAVAGEACSPTLARRHLETRPGGKLVNEYGPTEATVWAIATHLDAETIDPTVPIGRPVPYARAYLLDGSGHPVPEGVVGEIFLGGAGISSGYLGRPNLTAERFVPDPFSPGEGGRLYRTGDRGRIRVDGAIEFLGRLDHQVKIRGYRIEPGEIENRLEELDAVRQAVVVPRASESGEQRLVAYLVGTDDSMPTVSELRASLQENLPEYMIPSLFVTLEEMPLTPTGKVDINALPEPEQQRPDLATSYEPPEGRLETYLAGQWQEILETDRIGVHDNFFELGGNSIQAAIFMNRIRGEIDEFIHVGRLFENPSIRELTDYLEREHAEAVVSLGTGSASPGAAQADEPIRPREGDAERVDEMSDTEVDEMLETLLSEEESDG